MLININIWTILFIIAAIFIIIFLIEICQKFNQKFNELYDMVKANSQRLEELQNKSNSQ